MHIIDLARIYSIKTIILNLVDYQKSGLEFSNVIENIQKARECAVVSQLDASIRDIQSDECFDGLTLNQKNRLLSILRPE